jgi:DNA-binding LytR/AlgR family response regulator
LFLLHRRAEVWVFFPDRLLRQIAPLPVDLIHSCQRDIVVLDVKMPEMDGLGVIETIGIPAMPRTIFVTAYDEHAIRAFEANALDYMLKPCRTSGSGPP